MNKKQTIQSRTDGDQSEPVLQRNLQTLLMLVCVFGLSACGNKGDLYLPEKTDSPTTTEQQTDATEQTEQSGE